MPYVCQCGKIYDTQDGLNIHNETCSNGSLSVQIEHVSLNINILKNMWCPHKDIPNYEEFRKLREESECKIKGSDKLEKYRRDTESIINNGSMLVIHQAYSIEEIIDGMMPYILKHTKTYSTFRCPFEDCVEHGRVGVWEATKTDACIAPFANHAYLRIRTSIRRASMECGLIKKGEREGDLFGAPASLDAGPSSNDEDMILGNNIKITDVGRPILRDNEWIMPKEIINNPIDIIAKDESKERTKMFIDALIRLSGFSDQERILFCMSRGLFREYPLSLKEMCDAYDNKISRQSISKIIDKAEKKIQEFVKSIDINEYNMFNKVLQMAQYSNFI